MEASQAFQLPEVPAWDPTQGDLSRQYGLYPSQLIHKPEGYPATPSTQQMQAMGWWQCPTQKDTTGKPCGFWVSPQTKAKIEQGSGYFSCPKCQYSYDLMDELPWHGPEDAEESFGEDFRSGGGTRIGIPLADQGQIGENLVTQMGEIPGYGPITWWHPGGANSNSPLDGTTGDWGIEVKTINYDATHHRFAPGGGGDYTGDKNKAAAEMGLKGILGILVLLDYRRDVADIYVKEMPLTPWESRPGQWRQGVAQFRKGNAMKLVSEVPFQSPYKDPNNPSPGPYRVQDYYQKPPVVMPPGMEQQSEPAPF